MAGLVFGELGRQPEPGDEVRVDGIRLSVLEVEGTRIQRLEVEFVSSDEPSEDSTEAA
jgi:CBS domain containing-hemolysin-like protein